MRFLAMVLAWAVCAQGAQAARGGLDPRGEMHIPIGIANTVDGLKTFVEAEGNFSPGFGSYGIYFWVWGTPGKGTGPTSPSILAPTMEGVQCEHGLRGGGHLVPWSRWGAGAVEVTTEVCAVKRSTAYGEVYLDGARASLTNRGAERVTCEFRVALRGLGAAGGPVEEIEAVEDALLVDGHAAVVGNSKPEWVGVSAEDLWEKSACTKKARSAQGTGFGMMCYNVTLKPGEGRQFGFVCPVLPGRRVAGHRWDGVSTWAQFDLNKPNPAEGGVLQPNLGLAYWRQLKADRLFEEAHRYWNEVLGKVALELPDPRWNEAFRAIVAHSTMCMNEGAPDVAVVNFNVFNRDGVYMANIFQKSGNFELAEKAIEYFVGHPFNGRVQPEADNPGQILWVMGEHWKFTRSREWLERIYPAAQKIAAMIRYYRMTPEPHWVWDTSLEFGEALPANQRKQLRPGACDGFHPEYTEAFDIAGLRSMVELAVAKGDDAEAGVWSALAEELLAAYDKRFGGELPKGYGSYSVLWPCRLYPLAQGKGLEQFKSRGAQSPSGWRYFPLAMAHQGLLAGNRSAGWETMQRHLEHPQMRGWYALDEGGASGVGGWNHVRTTWKQGKESVAMPHGWAMAEFLLLLRDSLVFEDEGRLVLLAGVAPEWFKDERGMRWKGLPTHFGAMSFEYKVEGNRAEVSISGARPPSGYVLRVPEGMVMGVEGGNLQDGEARFEKGKIIMQIR